MNFRFKGPVYVGETITCNWVITAIDLKGRAKASVTITKEDDVSVIEAEIGGIVPGLEERKVLSQMLSEGIQQMGQLIHRRARQRRPKHNRLINADWQRSAAELPYGYTERSV